MAITRRDRYARIIAAAEALEAVIDQQVDVYHRDDLSLDEKRERILAIDAAERPRLRRLASRAGIAQDG